VKLQIVSAVVIGLGVIVAAVPAAWFDFFWFCR